MWQKALKYWDEENPGDLSDMVLTLSRQCHEKNDHFERAIDEPILWLRTRQSKSVAGVCRVFGNGIFCRCLNAI